MPSSQEMKVQNTFDKAMTGDTISILIMKKLWNSLPDELNPEKEAR